MNPVFDITRQRRGAASMRVAIVLSLLAHLAALLGLPQFRVPMSEVSALNETRGPLSVYLAPPPAALPAPPSLPAPPPVAALPSPPRAVARPRPAPPVIARKPSATEPVMSVPDTPPVIEPAPPAATAGDFASFVEARRRARGEAAPAAPAPGAQSTAPAEDANARANRLAAANLGSQRPLAFGYDPSKSGGIFQIERMGYDYAEFVFFGWNRQVRRNTAQLIDVRKGEHSDIRLAVVRRMISIIREYEQEDFLWESQRLGRNLTLSARLRDSAGLEDFLLREFFPEMRR